MIILSFFVINVMVRWMLDDLFDTLFYIFRLNHIRTMRPGWQLEVVKVVFTIMLTAPLFGAMIAATEVRS